MTHGFVVAQLVLTPEKPEVRQVDESRETGRRQRRDVPEEGEAKEPVEPAQRREASVRERTIEQRWFGSASGLISEYLTIPPCQVLKIGS